MHDRIIPAAPLARQRNEQTAFEIMNTIIASISKTITGASNDGVVGVAVLLLFLVVKQNGNCTKENPTANGRTIQFPNDAAKRSKNAVIHAIPRLMLRLCLNFMFTPPKIVVQRIPSERINVTKGHKNYTINYNMF